MPDGGFKFTRDELRAKFEALIPDIRYAAWGLGYAIGVHGTLTRDMDLIGVPWIENAGSGEQLAAAIADAVGGYWQSHSGAKPHGRRTWLIYPPFFGADKNYNGVGYIDLSVTARS